MRGPRSMAPCVARDRWHRAWPLREILGSFLTIYMEQIGINGAGGRVTVVGCSRFGGFRCPWGGVRCPSVVRARSMAPCVAAAQTSLCAVFAKDFCQNSSEPRCGWPLRPIVFSTLVSYRAGRCLRT